MGRGNASARRTASTSEARAEPTYTLRMDKSFEGGGVYNPLPRRNASPKEIAATIVFELAALQEGEVTEVKFSVTKDS
jgi:hypothetical protein